ncbi:MAG: leucyl aminopeptidase [Chlamydiota bacterium]
MQFSKERKEADLIIIPYWKGKSHAEKASAFTDFDDIAKLPIAAGDFKGDEAEIMLLYPTKGKLEKRVLLVGLGNKEKISLETCRRSYAAVVKAAIKNKWKELNVIIPEAKGMLEGVCEGLLLANYAFSKMKKESTEVVKKAALLGVDQKELTLCKKIGTVSSAVNFARDLVNSNADEITPQALAKFAKDLEKEFPKIKTTVFGKKEIEKHKMGLLLAVSRASRHDPAFIIIEYQGNPSSKKRSAIVGKGITYDTGGLNIKPTGSMETMKCDMAGAAAVLGTLRAAAELDLKANIVGVIAATENAISADAYKPGDVYISYLGTSVEIDNTDAEGRLVLADALAYTEEHLKPSCIVDLATLTGSVVVALGEEVTGLFSNDDTLANALIASGEKTHERLWRMPIYQEYRDQLKSSIADIKNAGGRKGGSITAAIFLKEFIKDTPWAHLDIAGTAYPAELKHYHTTHATGVGVRLLIDYLQKNG